MDNEYNVYEDINTRTGGELYLGIVGPVRTGKSTFMDSIKLRRKQRITKPLSSVISVHKIEMTF